MGATCSTCRTLSSGYVTSQLSEDVSSEQVPLRPMLPRPRIWAMPHKQHKLKPPLHHPIGQEDELEFQCLEDEFTFYFKTATFHPQNSATKKEKLDHDYFVDCQEDEEEEEKQPKEKEEHP